MLKQKVYLVLVLITALIGSAMAQTNSYDLFKTMYSKYSKKVCRTYTFSQKNTHYQNDTVSGKSEWHEAVEFPDKFKIVFGEKAKGNYVIFKNDSIYSYRKSNLVKAGADSNVLLLLLGGMYYRQIGDALNRLKAANYDLGKFSTQDWNGKHVFVLGAKKNDLQSNQFWVDANTLVIVRIIEKMNATDWMDMRFESHQPLCGGYVENKVSFRRNGNLEQVEEYYDIKESDKFPD
jgi:hypothetical protein